MRILSRLYIIFLTRHLLSFKYRGKKIIKVCFKSVSLKGDIFRVTLNALPPPLELCLQIQALTNWMAHISHGFYFFSISVCLHRSDL